MNILSAVAPTLVLRLLFLRRFWGAPGTLDKQRFFTARLEPEARQRLLRRYRGWLLVPFGLDAAILAAIAASGILNADILFEQIGATVATVFFQYLVAFQFSAIAKSMEGGPVPELRSASLAVRSLRHYTHWPMEMFIGFTTLTGLALLVVTHRGWSWPLTPSSTHYLGRILWLFYAPLGLFLLKHVIVRSRVLLPRRRAEDFQRWREAWIRHMLGVIDLMRVLFALAPLFIGLTKIVTSLGDFPRTGVVAMMIALLLGSLTPFVIGSLRSERRLAALQKEIDFQALILDIPSAGVADGRFLAGGFLFLNRDHPAMLVRSPNGMAINVASAGTYAWLGYLAGLLGLGVLTMIR